MKQIPIMAAVSDGIVRPGHSPWSINQFLADAASAWRLSKRATIAICSIPFLVALSGVVAALLGKNAYKWFTDEDGFAENLQVLFYSLAFILSLMITRHQWKSGQKVIAILYLGVSFGLFFLIGEELSWGQRLIGWETSESLNAINKQGETNLHNIYGVGSTFKWLQLLVGAYGTILPLVVLGSMAFVPYRETLAWLVPHYTMVPYFLFLFIWRIYRNLFEAPTRYYFAIEQYNEVMELILALGFFVFMVFQFRRINARENATASVPAETHS